jgi:hypothetical protein
MAPEGSLSDSLLIVFVMERQKPFYLAAFHRQIKTSSLRPWRLCGERFILNLIFLVFSLQSGTMQS